MYSEIVPSEISIKEIEDINHRPHVKGIILSGGSYSVYEPEDPKIDPQIFNMGIPILGLCYGHQLIAHIGGKLNAEQNRNMA